MNNNFLFLMSATFVALASDLASAGPIKLKFKDVRIVKTTTVATSAAQFLLSEAENTVIDSDGIKYTGGMNYSTHKACEKIVNKQKKDERLNDSEDRFVRSLIQNDQSSPRSLDDAKEIVKSECRKLGGSLISLEHKVCVSIKGLDGSITSNFGAMQNTYGSLFSGFKVKDVRTEFFASGIEGICRVPELDIGVQPDPRPFVGLPLRPVFKK